ncbi:hypothetical protein BLOT_010022 [Blomia tropicalis]|nr:hypothetical protein BLOT_010022 [Blomia tropicalis]
MCHLICMTRLKCVTPYQIVFQSTIKQPKKDKKEKSCGKDQDQENLDEASFDLLPLNKNSAFLG